MVFHRENSAPAIEFALCSVPNRCAADLVGSKDMISYIDAELNDGATSVAGYGRPETWPETFHTKGSVYTLISRVEWRRSTKAPGSCRPSQ